VALTGSFIRLGNLFNSEILGLPADLPWAVVFERIDQTARHPVQVYESISYFLIFVLLWGLYRRWGEDTPRGLLIGLFFTLVFGVRILWETFKVGQAHFELALPLGMSMGQLLSLPAVAVGLWLVWRSLRTPAATAK